MIHVLQPNRPEFNKASPAHLLAESELKRHSDPFAIQISPNNDNDKMELKITATGAAELANYIKLGSARFENADYEYSDPEVDTGTGLRHVAETSGFYPDRSNGINSKSGWISHRWAFESEKNDDTGTAEANHTVSLEIQRIVDVVNHATTIPGRAPLLYAKGISKSNKTPCYPGVDVITGAWDRLRELVKIPDQDGSYYRLIVDLDGGVSYGKIDTEPRYYYFPPPKGIRTLGDDIPTWDARPEIIKLIDPIGVGLPHTWLGDGSLILPERTTMRMYQDSASFTTLEYTSADFRLAKEANERRIIQKLKAKKRK